MSIAYLQTQVQQAVKNGYPNDGSKPLPRRVERMCKLIAAENMTLQSIADTLGVSHVTVWRTRKHAPVAARIRYLRDQLAAQAYEDEPLVDKRNRVVAAAKLARTLHEKLEANDYTDVIAVTKQGIEIHAHDRWRVQHYLDALAAVHRMVDGDSKQGTTVNVSTSISMEDAAVRVAALFSRMPDVIEAESEEVKGDALSAGGGEGSRE